MNFRLDGKVAIITGSSRGIGAALATGYAEAGASLLLVSRSAPSEEMLARIAATGQPYYCLSADLSKLENIKPVVQTALEKFGQIDILVNNAGIVRRASVLEYTEEDWDSVLDTNLKVPFFLAQAVAQYMVERGQGGKIVNICSLLSFQGGILVPGYTAAKHGLAGITKAMGNELATHGINVNGIAPGYIRTNNTAPLIADEARYNAILERIPQGRWGEGSDLVGAAVFLAGSGSNWMQGHILAVDGGWLGR
ncbi:2-dehydro-3-deoxy-D-gluconate 5-dehydrogenase KduD [Candidatus Chlorohelix sp.]|uniref:2-dehydro-3-deoxy-D-gluconate 5-dehydrogenase KduD n=1 Tax=Candidatus Chlorohelix sp. TaxID=3139201 RepID=UPI0031450C58